MTRRIFNSVETAARHLQRQGLSPQQIAQATGKSPAWVGAVLQKTPPWLDAAALSRRYNDGATFRQIADEFHTSPTTVRRKLKEHGITLRPLSATPPRLLEAEEMAQRYQQGRSLSQIADEFGESYSTVRQKLRKHGVAMRPQVAPRRPLDVEAMALRYEQGRSLPQVSREFNVPFSTVRDRLQEYGVSFRGKGYPTRLPLDVEAMARRYENGHSLAQVAEEFKTSSSTVWRRLNEYGVAPRPRSRTSQRPLDALSHSATQSRTSEGGASRSLPRPMEDLVYGSMEEAIAALYTSGISMEKIAQVTGRSTTYVRNRLAESGVKTRRGTGNFGIDPQQLAELYQSIPSRKVLAEALHVAPGTILTVLRENGHSTLIRPQGDWRATAEEAAPLRLPLPKSSWEITDAKIIDRYLQRKGTTQIAHELQLSPARVLEAIRYHRSRDKITAQIHRRHAAGESRTRIAAVMGIRISKVNAVLATPARRAPAPPGRTHTHTQRRRNEPPARSLL